MITLTSTPHDQYKTPTASVLTAPSSPALILTWYLAWSLICHGLKWFIYWLLETEEWMGWMGTWYGNWRKSPENWRSRDRLYPERWTGNSSISESQFQIQTTLWAYLGWCPRTPLRAFMVAWVWPHAQQTLSLCTQASRMSLLWEPGPSHLGTFHVFKLLHSESKRVIFGNPLLWATYLCLIPTTLGWALKSVSK